MKFRRGMPFSVPSSSFTSAKNGAERASVQIEFVLQSPKMHSVHRLTIEDDYIKE